MQALRDDSGMKITASTEQVLEKLKENRKTHLSTYEDALKGYHVAAINKLQKLLTKFTNTSAEDMEDLYLSLPKPTSQLDAYDTAIAMLTYHVESEVILTASQVQCFIQDNWDWKRGFVEVSSSYTGRG